jgi:hypothetical protein
MKGQKVCRMHGGKSLKGFASPLFKTGRYSRYIPGPLEPAVTAFLAAGDPLDLIQAIGTWEGRADTLLRSLEAAGDPLGAWEELAGHWHGMWEATAAGEPDEVRTHRGAIDVLLSAGRARAETWEQLKEADETRLKLIDTEDKKRERARGYVTAEQLRFQNNALRLAVVEAVELIEDPQLQRKVRTAIAERFIQIVGPAALPRPVAAGRAD